MSANSSLSFAIETGIRSDETLIKRAHRALRSGRSVSTKEGALTAAVRLGHFQLETKAERLSPIMLEQIGKVRKRLLKKFKITDFEYAQKLREVNQGECVLKF